MWDGGKRTTQQKVVEVLFSTSLAGCKSAAGCGCMVWCFAALGMLAHPSCIGAVLHKSACMQCCMVAAAAWWSADCLRHSHAQGGTGARRCSTCTQAHLASFFSPTTWYNRSSGAGCGPSASMPSCTQAAPSHTRAVWHWCEIMRLSLLVRSCTMFPTRTRPHCSAPKSARDSVQLQHCTTWRASHFRDGKAGSLWAWRYRQQACKRSACRQKGQELAPVQSCTCGWLTWR